MANADVAITAANCEKRRAALSVAHNRSHVGDQLPLRGVSAALRTARFAIRRLVRGRLGRRAAAG
jgi:hypothetical protein